MVKGRLDEGGRRGLVTGTAGWIGRQIDVVQAVHFRTRWTGWQVGVPVHLKEQKVRVYGVWKILMAALSGLISHRWTGSDYYLVD